MLEHFVNETDHNKSYLSASPELTAAFVTADYPNVYWTTTNDTQRQYDKVALIREIVQAMPDSGILQILHEVFITRCQGPLGNVVHTPTFMKQARIFSGCLDAASREGQVTALLEAFSLDALACHLLAVSISGYLASNICSCSPTIARARSRLSSHPFSSLLVCYTSYSSCGSASSVRCTFTDMEKTCITMSLRRGVAFLCFNC